LETQLPNSENLFQLISLDKSVKTTGGVLRVGRFLVGRAESCDIIVHSGVVSSVHAVVEVTPTGLKIYDMNSKNGTYIGKEKIVARDVHVGEVISLGNIPFKLERYQVEQALPPVLDALDPVKGDASVFKTMPSPPPLESSAPPAATPDLPSETPKVTPRQSDEEIPYIVYPLSADPNSDYSEYIFEDKDQLYPIFKYEINKNAVEIIILHKDKVYSVDYLPDKKATYEIAGARKSKKAKDVEFPYLGKEERIPFIEIQAGNCVVHQLHKYEMLYLSDNSVKKASDGRVNLQENDIVKLSSGDLEIYVRRVPAPPKVKPAPFFRRDQQLKRYLFLVFLMVFLPLVSLYLYPVDKELLNEKDPERIATILYKQKLKVNTNKTVAQSEKKKAVKQKSKQKKVLKKKTVQKTQATPQKSTAKKTPTKDPGTKTAPKKQVVKRVKDPKPKSDQKAKDSSKSKAKSAQKRSQRRYSRTNLKSPGKVDTYKSMNFKSTVSSLMAKGGSLSGARTARTDSGMAINNAGVQGGGVVETAKTGTQVGSLTGGTEGKLAATRGSEGLTNKTGVYTAGIPSETVVLGSMDPDVIRRILREHIPQFRSCYQKELNRNSANISGQIRLVFTIGASGAVSRAGVDGNSSLPGNVRGCVVNVLRGIQFPSPLGGGTVDVKQPFNFYPKRI
tara:strand:+ start:4752 stop:6776 length:2025 start_codon:yes stop_codon:yes gene_type:complete